MSDGRNNNMNIGPTDNGIIISELLRVLSEINCKNGKNQFIIQLISFIPRMFFILLSKYLVEQCKDFNSYISRFFNFIFYRSTKFNATKGIGAEISLLGNHESKYNNALMGVQQRNEYCTVSHLRLIRNCAAYNELMQLAQKRANVIDTNRAECINITYKFSGLTEYAIVPNKLYPSRNFRLLTSIIDGCIDTAIMLEQYKVIPILLNGEPGLGKSKSLDYLAFNSKLKIIKKVDLTGFINHAERIKFTDILAYLSKKVSMEGDHTLIIFDELDKYINATCKNDEDPAKINESILNDVLNFIESDIRSRACIFMLFCSNNFGTIFDFINPADKIHYQSFEDRFLKLIYHKMDKEEFVDYINWTCAKLQKPYKCNADCVPDDFSITFRHLDQFIRANNYDMDKICREIKSDALVDIPQEQCVARVKPPKIKEAEVEFPEYMSAYPELQKAIRQIEAKRPNFYQDFMEYELNEEDEPHIRKLVKNFIEIDKEIFCVQVYAGILCTNNISLLNKYYAKHPQHFSVAMLESTKGSFTPFRVEAVNTRKSRVLEWIYFDKCIKNINIETLVTDLSLPDHPSLKKWLDSILELKQCTSEDAVMQCLENIKSSAYFNIHEMDYRSFLSDDMYNAIPII